MTVDQELADVLLHMWWANAACPLSTFLRDMTPWPPF